MTPAILPQAAPVGFPRIVGAPTTASDHGIAVYGHARAGNRLSPRFGLTATTMQRDHVLDTVIREAEGAFPQAARRPHVATALRRDVDHEARPQRHEAQHERHKSIASLVARLACGLFKQRRDAEAASRRASVEVQIIPRLSAGTTSRGLDEHAWACRGSS